MKGFRRIPRGISFSRGGFAGVIGMPLISAERGNWSAGVHGGQECTPTYFPRLDWINSHGTSEILQFLHGCSSMTLHRIRLLLQVLHAFFARDRALVEVTGEVALLDIVSPSYSYLVRSISIG